MFCDNQSHSHTIHISEDITVNTAQPLSAAAGVAAVMPMSGCSSTKQTNETVMALRHKKMIGETATRMPQHSGMITENQRWLQWRAITVDSSSVKLSNMYAYIIQYICLEDESK